MSAETGKHQGNKDPKLKEASIPRSERISGRIFGGRPSDWKSRREQPDVLAGYEKSWTGHCVGSDPSQTEEEPNRSFSVRETGNMGTPAALGSFAPHRLERKKWIIFVLLNGVEP
jgi:hypothetical protein